MSGFLYPFTKIQFVSVLKYQMDHPLWYNGWVHMNVLSCGHLHRTRTVQNHPGPNCYISNMTMEKRLVLF